MSVTAPRRPMKSLDPRRQPLPLHIGLRLSGDQYASVLFLAQRDGLSASAAVRSMIDDWSAEHPEAADFDPFAATESDRRQAAS